MENWSMLGPVMPRIDSIITNYITIILSKYVLSLLKFSPN